MLRILAGVVAVSLVTLPAVAQTASPGAQDQVTVPQGNSGAKVQGLPGNKSGPATKPPSGTTGAGATESPNGKAGPNEDAAKVQGLPGNKSGPAVKSPSSSAK